MQCARLAEEHLKHLHKQFVVEQVDPEAPLDNLLFLLGFFAIEDALKGYCHRSQLLVLFVSQLLELFFERWDGTLLDNLLLGHTEDLWIKHLRVQVD